MVKRFYFIDFLRVIAIVMMFVFHVSMIFVSQWGWHIKNSETSNMLLELNFWMSSFRMPLLFFVSGFISYILMKRMTTKSFTYQRFIRLIIPTVIWTFILVAPQIFFERKLQGNTQTYIEFYKTFLEFNLWPTGNFHWLHLWFIPYLFCYNLLSIPVFKLLQQTTKLSHFLEQQSKKLSFIFVFAFVAILPYTLLYFHFPASYDLVNDFARHSFFIFFILAGLLFFRFQSILDLLEDRRRIFLTLSFLCIVIINAIRWNGLEPILYGDELQTSISFYSYLFLLNFNTWMWVLCSLGYGKRYLNIRSKRLAYANTAIYPFYILHQTVIVIISYYVVQTSDSTTLKYGFLLVVCFLVTVLIYHVFIKPYNTMRFLFGMKKIKSDERQF